MAIVPYRKLSFLVAGEFDVFGEVFTSRDGTFSVCGTAKESYFELRIEPLFTVYLNISTVLKPCQANEGCFVSAMVFIFISRNVFVTRSLVLLLNQGS